MFPVLALFGRRLAEGVADEQEDAEEKEVLDPDAVRERHRAPLPGPDSRSRTGGETKSWNSFYHRQS